MSQIRVKKSNKYIIIAKVAFIMMLVFGSGTGSLFAEENPASATTSQNEQGSELTAGPVNDKKAPSLLPGDFFYFIKTVYENIRLAITFDDVKEAKLLAGFAQERLAEANALVVNGEAEKSAQLLQKSLKTQQLAVDKVNSKTEKPLKNNELEQVKEVKSDLQHNIVALAAALEKVKNQQAQQSILKNIQKSFGHLEKKLAKLENKPETLENEESGTVPSESDAEIASPKETSEHASSENESELESGSKADAAAEKGKKTKPEKKETAKQETKPAKQKKDHEYYGKADNNQHKQSR